MAQKILSGRAADPALTGDLVQVKVDHVVLSRAPARAFAEALHAGLKKTTAEVAIAYDGTCVTGMERSGNPAGAGGASDASVPPEVTSHGIVIARPGVGFPAMVHLERFASPARLCVTDDPRLAGVGGVGMMSIVMPPGQLGQALAHGSVWLRPPRSIQVLLNGRVRPFVCARDVALELIRRGLGDAVKKVEAEHGAPVVLEYAGPSARLLSVSERAVLSALSPHLGAAAALFVSDERTEVFLRDQRRSKAHRALAPDAGAPCDEVVNVDLGAVDPLLLDEDGQVRAVRDLAGKPVSQVLLGGDSGVTLRDLFAAAALLKSKRVPSRLDLLLSVPSRQMLEVLASSGALADLIATGARLIEPDARVMSGELYPPPDGGISLRSCDPEPSAKAFGRSSVVASAETLAYAVASGEIGDPRSFKRPVRVTVPRTLPTDDVLVVRERRSGSDASKGAKPAAPALPSTAQWKGAESLECVELAGLAASTKRDGVRDGSLAVVCTSVDEVRRAAQVAVDGARPVRAIVAAFVPSAIVALLSGVGVVALQTDAKSLPDLKGKALHVPAPSALEAGESVSISGAAASSASKFTWLALGAERSWTAMGSARPAPKEAKAVRAVR